MELFRDYPAAMTLEEQALHDEHCPLGMPRDALAPTIMALLVAVSQLAGRVAELEEREFDHQFEPDKLSDCTFCPVCDRLWEECICNA